VAAGDPGTAQIAAYTVRVHEVRALSHQHDVGSHRQAAAEADGGPVHGGHHRKRDVAAAVQAGSRVEVDTAVAGRP
jgi:hypothetical protein